MYTKSEHTNKTNKTHNTLAVQTDISKSKYNADCMPEKDLKHTKLQDHNKSMEKQRHLVMLKENVAKHHQLGEIPK